MDGDHHAIEVLDVARRFGRVWALNDVSFGVVPGEIFGLVGPDGAGKTTLLQLLAAILDPSQGRCVVLGYDTVREATSVTSRIGYMPQGFTLYGRLTVDENLAFAAKVRGVTVQQLAERRERLLTMARLGPFLHRRESDLSGGMRKKLALCTNLVHQPPLLLLDEPGLGVDPLSRRELWRMLEDFRSQGTTIVLSTSYMDEAERCDRVAFLDGGRVVALGAPRDLRAGAADAVFFVTSDAPDEVEEALRRTPHVIGIQRRADETRFAVARGETLPETSLDRIRELGRLEPAPPSMEDVFVLVRGEEEDESQGAAGDGGAFPAAFASNDQGPAIQSDQLTRRFGDFIAVDGVSLEIGSGEIFGLLGANGAGKTTLIRMLCGLLAPSSGTAQVAGQDIAADPRRLRQRIGYMSQRFSLYFDLTVGENLAFFAKAYGLARSRGRDSIEWASGMTGIRELHDEPVAQLSGAVRQRLALACSVLHRPKVLFLDEPTSGVDPESRYRFWRLVIALAGTGTTVLVTTHYLQEAAYCDRLGLMHQGRLIAEGDLATLRAGLEDDVGDTIEDVFLAHIERDGADVPPAVGAGG